MKKIKFFTTFSGNGYHVYGRDWIETFLQQTEGQEHISARVYINNFDDLASLDYGPRVEIVDFDQELPTHKDWLDNYSTYNTHHPWNRKLCMKFSYKSFVIINELKKNTDNYAIWFDADGFFMSNNYENFPATLLENKFIACQHEHNSQHVESGILIFDTAHSDKQRFVDQLDYYYQRPEEYNSFGQFFDGFAIYRALNSTQISYVDLNEKYGISGIQSDPNCTFLHPELNKRFHHNIGITGKNVYKEWNKYQNIDEYFTLIQGPNGNPELLKERIAYDIEQINKILASRNQ